MKKIDIHNYEEFAIDYMSGTLPQKTEQAFVQFLSENPSIADEILLFNMETSILNKEENQDFSYLHKDLNDCNINATNFEEFCIAAAEGDLSSKTKETLDLYIGTNMALKKEVESYSKLKLQKDEITFALKDQLKKSAHKPLILKRAIRIAATSAAAVILLFIALLTPSNQNNNIQELAMTSSFKNYEYIPQTPQKIDQTIQDNTFEVKNEEAFHRPEELLAKHKVPVVKQNKKENTQIIILEKLQLKVVKPLQTTPVTIKNIALASPRNNKLDTKDVEQESEFKQLASNYIYTKVLSKGISNINKIAETSLDYQIIENKDGEPVKVVFSTRFGKINHTLAQR